MRRIGLGPAGIRYAFVVAIAAYAVVGVFSITGHAGQARQVTAGGSYSAAQATRGKTLVHRPVRGVPRRNAGRRGRPAVDRRLTS